MRSPAAPISPIFIIRMQPIGGGLVLVPGFTSDGKDDSRLVNLAFSLSRARFLVLVPDLSGPREMRVRLEDSRGIADAALHFAQMDLLKGHQGVGVVAISYAAGLAILATMESGGRAPIRFLVSIGGYYDTAALATFVTTGRFRQSPGARWQSRDPHPAAKWFFLAGNIDLLLDAGDRRALLAIAERRMDDVNAPIGDLATRLGADGRSMLELLENTDPDRVEALLRELPDSIQTHLQRLSLRNHDLSHLAGRLLLVHGREDSMIPYTESQALASAVPGSQLFLIDGFSAYRLRWRRTHRAAAAHRRDAGPSRTARRGEGRDCHHRVVRSDLCRKLSRHSAKSFRRRGFAVAFGEMFRVGPIVKPPSDAAEGTTP